MAGYTFQQLAAAYRADPIYWGVSAAPAASEAFIESLASRANATARYSFKFTVNATGANKIYLALPSRFGAVILIEDNIAGGFISYATGVSVTDLMGVLQPYTIYESASAGLGLTTLSASW